MGVHNKSQKSPHLLETFDHGVTNTRMIFRLDILIILLSLSVAIITGKLECYSCVSQGGNYKCITDPANADGKPVVQCDYKYCTIRRNELPDGTLFDFYRGCEENPLSDGKHESENSILWAQSCTWDRCNVGDGLHPITPGGDDDDDDVIIVPGSAARPTAVILSLLLSVCTYILCSSSFFSSSLF